MNTVRLTQLKDLLVSTKAARRGYALVRRAHARALARQGRDLEAAESLLRACRLCGVDEFGDSGYAQLQDILNRTCYEAGRLVPSARNRLRLAFLETTEAREMREEFRRFPIGDRIRMRYPRDEVDSERQGDLIILKRPGHSPSEKGVLLVTYTQAIRRFVAMYDVGALAARYMIVLEPSSWGYEDTTFLFLAGSDLQVLVQCPWIRDARFIDGMGLNLSASRLGAGDWVDPEIFRPAEGPRIYDLAMVSSWHPLKRHRDLFRALSGLKQRGKRLKVALVGYPAGWTKVHIKELMRRHHVEDQCELFESIPPDAVSRILGQSRGYVLLSRREGANRALYESLFCDTPVVVYRWHRGVKTDFISEEVGVLYDDDNLDDALLRVVEGSRSFRPRQWADANTGWRNATRIMNGELREIALRLGLPWTEDMAAKKMAPNLRYADAACTRTFDSAYEELREYLLD